MTDILNRYPGAQPFRDSEFSRRTFFGRGPASIALADQILANRLIIVYAKSGLGKTSLLNAGVAPRLREAGSVPLFVRVNDIKRGPLTSVIEGIRAEAERQQVEYVPGETGSLWNFFKSVEFWRKDLLLMPVLVIDQFEELFTLQPEAAREEFLSELGYLVRGVPPPSLQLDKDGAKTTPPPVRVVLSLREDFLGMLDEVTDRIPQIMDHRFRLTPLTCETAAEAITCPAAIDDPSLPTKPFRLDQEFVTTILNYLTKSTAGASRSLESRYVEPFHLQLICQRMEKVVAFKQKLSSAEIVFSLKDLGGEAALAETLASFYTDAIQSVHGSRLRGAVRRLCEQYLISPEGRRLSVEERELQRQLKLPHETLSQLVDCRLLRTDRRSDSTYYELSHDALVQPVLASRRMQALVVGWAGVLAGSVVSFLAGGFILILILYAFSGKVRNLADYIVFVILIAAMGAIGALGSVWLRAGIRRRKRYRRHDPNEFTQLPTIRPLKDGILGWSIFAVGSVILAPWGFMALFLIFFLACIGLNHGQLPQWLSSQKDQGLVNLWQTIKARPMVELGWVTAELATILAFGIALLRQAARKLWPQSISGRPRAASVPGVTRPRSLALSFSKIVGGVIAFAVAAAGVLALRQCVYVTNGTLPHWVSQSITGSGFTGACRTLHRGSWDFDNVTLAMFFFSAVIFSLALFGSGVRDARNVFQHRQGAR